MAQLARGTTLFLATIFGTELGVTAVTNATEAEMTVTSHGLATGDIIEVVRTGWGRLNRRAFRVTVVDPDTLKLDRCNTTNEELFIPGEGIGIIRKAEGWKQITQVTELASSGGEAQQIEYHYLEDENNYSLNNGFSAVSYTVTLDADAIDTEGFDTLEAFTETQRDTVFRIRKRDGGLTLLPCTVALSSMESYTDGQIMTTTASVYGRSRPVRYKGE